MLDNILNLEGVAVLNKKQQMSVNGGECAYYNGATGSVDYHLSSQEAQSMLSNASDHWCCASCSTASWFNPNHCGRYTIGLPNITCDEIE